MLTRLLACAALAASACAVPARAAQALPVALPGHVPGWAVPAHRVGAVDPAEEVEVQFVLPWRDRDAVERMVRDVSDPASPAYRRYLTPEQFRARFAPPRSSVDVLHAWLRGAGLRPGPVPANRLTVPARGSAAAVARAFGTTLGRYDVRGQALRAPDRAPVLPAAVARLVAGVRGLDQSSLLIRPGAFDEVPPPDVTVPPEPDTPADTPAPPATQYAAPCSAYDGERLAKSLPAVAGKVQPYVTCATTPAQLRAAYGIPRGVDGAGQTIVVTGSHSVKRLAADLAEWSRRRGVPALRSGQLRQIAHPGGNQVPVVEPILRPTVWAVQTATLFEHVRAVAPAADLVYVGSTSSLDILTATAAAVDGKLGNVVVNGWYTLSEDVPAPEVVFMSQVAEQAATSGISLLFASGDLADGTRSGNSSPSVAFPANEPNATSVGATSLLLGRNGAYQRELGWAKGTYEVYGRAWEEPDESDAMFRGSGGGVSEVHDQPAYQRGVVPSAVAERESGGLGRAVPDIAVAGDPETGLLIGYTMSFPNGARYAERRLATDTSATALFGALLALANQRAGEDLGFVNPLLYSTWKAHRNAYRDVVRSGRRWGRVRNDYAGGASGNVVPRLKMFEEWTSLVPRPGYDTVTGLGTPAPAFWKYVR